MDKDHWVNTEAKNKEEWPDGVRPRTFGEDGRPTIWWYLLALPCICLLCAFHFTMCMIAMVSFRTERRRKQFYEYYSPWGWGKYRCENEEEDEVQAVQDGQDGAGMSTRQDQLDS